MTIQYINTNPNTNLEIEQIEQELKQDLNKLDNNYKLPKKINLNFIEDNNIFLSSILHPVLYKVFLLLNPLHLIINSVFLYLVENEKFYHINNYYSKFAIPSLYISSLFINLYLSIYLNFFKFKISYFILNNFINFIEIFYIYYLDNDPIKTLTYKKVYYINTIIYMFITNICIGLSNINNKIKLNTQELIKELDNENYVNTNNMFF